MFRVDLPRVSRRKQQEMLPWLLEDRLLSPPNDFEFILSEQSIADETLVYAIEKSVLGQWLLLAEAASVSPVTMAPDFLALPYEEGRWTLYTDEGRLLVRTGPGEGFAADLHFGWQQLELLLGQLESPVRLPHLSSSEVDIPENLAGQLDTETGKINWSFTELPVGLNLLPPAYRPRRSGSMGAWIPSLAAAVAFIMLSVGYMLVQSWAWQRDALILEEAVVQAYEQLFAQSYSGPAINTDDSARQKLELLEHQYIGTQSSPMAELSALDRVFSTCSDCVLMGVTQVNDGLDIRLKENTRLASRLNGIDGWSINRRVAGPDGISTLRVRQARP